MKDRIEELARKAGWTGIYSSWSSPTEWESMTVPVTRKQVADFLNEALELAAREAERYEPDEKTSYVNYASQAIRKLKVE